MKRNYFQKTYNLISYFLLIGVINLVLSLCLKLLVTLFDGLDILFLNNTIILVRDKFNLFGNYTKHIAIVLVLVAVSLITIELFQRILNDSITDYFKSVYQTIRLRQFLMQDEQSASEITIDNHDSITKFNPILRNFNQPAGKAIVDIRKNYVSVFIKYPKTQQAQKLLRDMEMHIKEEISSRNPDYYFSSPNREGNKLWYIGTKR